MSKSQPAYIDWVNMIMQERVTVGRNEIGGGNWLGMHGIFIWNSGNSQSVISTSLKYSINLRGVMKLGNYLNVKKRKK